MKKFVFLGLAFLSYGVMADELPDECKVFLSDAEKMFKLIELDEKMIQTELVKYQTEMKNMDSAKLVRMCADAVEAIKEQMPELESQLKQIHAIESGK